ncbi:MAG: hypothetical protein Q9209_003646 [Squamulea sp. 1 TL-2023]
MEEEENLWYHTSPKTNGELVPPAEYLSELNTARQGHKIFARLAEIEDMLQERKESVHELLESGEIKASAKSSRIIAEITVLHAKACVWLSDVKNATIQSRREELEQGRGISAG